MSKLFGAKQPTVAKPPAKTVVSDKPAPVPEVKAVSEPLAMPVGTEVKSTLASNERTRRSGYAQSRSKNVGPVDSIFTTTQRKGMTG